MFAPVRAPEHRRSCTHWCRLPWCIWRPVRSRQSPLSTLAGVLIVTAFRMISVTTVRKILRSRRSDAVTFVQTAAGTVGFDLIEAVEIGLLVTAFFALGRLPAAAVWSAKNDPAHITREMGG